MWEQSPCFLHSHTYAFIQRDKNQGFQMAGSSTSLRPSTALGTCLAFLSLVCRNEWLNEWRDERRWPWYVEVLSMHRVVMQTRQAANHEYVNVNFLSCDQYGSQPTHRLQAARRLLKREQQSSRQEVKMIWPRISYTWSGVTKWMATMVQCSTGLDTILKGKPSQYWQFQRKCKGELGGNS